VALRSVTSTNVSSRWMNKLFQHYRPHCVQTLDRLDLHREQPTFRPEFTVDFQTLVRSINTRLSFRHMCYMSLFHFGRIVTMASQCSSLETPLSTKEPPPAPHVDVVHSNLLLSPDPNEQRASAATHQCLSPRAPCSRRIPRTPRIVRLASVREFLFDEPDDPAALMCGEANFSTHPG